MTPISPLTTEQTIRYKLPAATDGNGMTVALVATDAGDRRDIGGSNRRWPTFALCFPPRSATARSSRDFAGLDEKSKRHFPTFLGLRAAMGEESVRFLTDLFQRDGSILAP